MHPPTLVYRPDTLDSVRSTMLAAFADGAHRVVLDLDTLTRLDTEGVRGLITLLRRSREVGGELALKVTRPELLRSLQVMALDRLFPMVRDIAA
ncbi:MAG TPA: STAS domain-containing protein [Candidatus Baltobacteraceae bacterium]|nr:STAS domain-containing protein [Candidatus Baltobacteraceae bacterium]